MPAEVRAVVLKVDTAAGKLSLGLKPSYFADEEEGMESGSEEEPEMDLDEELAEEFDAAAAAAQVSAIPASHHLPTRFLPAFYRLCARAELTRRASPFPRHQEVAMIGYSPFAHTDY